MSFSCDKSVLLHLATVTSAVSLQLAPSRYVSVNVCEPAWQIEWSALNGDDFLTDLVAAAAEKIKIKNLASLLVCVFDDDEGDDEEA